MVNCIKIHVVILLVFIFSLLRNYTLHSRYIRILN